MDKYRRMQDEISKGLFLKSFGKRLKSLRHRSGLSYRKLAQRCNVDYSNINQIEKGRVDIQLTTLLELARGLDVPPSHLLEFDISDC